ncbi:MAG: type II CRISPR-associated endonuclease Cas1 [Bacteroidales bacterium]|nr:type II CRISPR-associated endonuclease Cas1 [Bacteroidales bacterium]MDD4671218.1 type II CRISPR-associated endonuclease Cas1 [Bacteroidales bacterium]
MPKQTIVISSPADLSLHNNQISIKVHDCKKDTIFRPIEDIRTVLIDNHSAHITIPLINALADNNIAVIICNERHIPNTMLMDLESNSLQTKSFRAQLEASVPLKKQIWKQIVEAKIRNQSSLLDNLGYSPAYLKKYYDNVKSGDSTNREGAAAKEYWKKVFGTDFIRDRYAPAPNNLLNYGYALLRASVARALMNSGLLPSIGVFHKNYFNSFPLADDVMEPYRPFIDAKVIQLHNRGISQLDKHIKYELIELFYQSITESDLSTTTSSLSKIYCGENRYIIYPSLKTIQ